jgi:chemotaxis protein MotB
MAKKKKEPAPPSKEWMGTYGDMITLILCFFVMLYNPDEADPLQMAALVASIQGDPTGGGQSLASGRMSDLGNTINSLPAMERGRTLGPSAKKAISLFAPDVKSNKISIRNDERGLIITMISDAFFEQGSAELKLDQARDTLMRVAQFVSSPEMKDKHFRIEGHTDSQPLENSIWPSLWELSTARSTNVLHYLSDFGINERQFSVAGFADTKPLYPDDTPEGRAYNRRIDIIMLDDGHF